MTSNLIPEQRVDKNGRLNTKHVRATPKAGNTASGVPAPALGSAVVSTASGAAHGSYKPRPSQKQQKHRVYDSGFANYNEQLKTPDEHGEKWGRSITFLFTASDVEMYEVLGVADNGDAIRLLASGIRTSEGAIEYMRSKGAEESIIDRSGLTQGALERAISSEDFIVRLPETTVYDTAEMLDALELHSISSLAGQSYRLLSDVLQEKIKVSDIKHLGVSKLKSHDRLISTAPALRRLNEPDPPFTIDDLKMLVYRAAAEHTKTAAYRDVVSYVIERGVGTLEDVKTLRVFGSILNDHHSNAKGYEEAEYEVAFYNAFEGSSHRVNSKRIMGLRNAGVPPKEAAGMVSQGMSDLAIIAVAQEGTEKPFAEGWL